MYRPLLVGEFIQLLLILFLRLCLVRTVPYAFILYLEDGPDVARSTTRHVFIPLLLG